MMAWWAPKPHDKSSDTHTDTVSFGKLFNEDNLSWPGLCQATPNGWDQTPGQSLATCDHGPGSLPSARAGLSQREERGLAPPTGHWAGSRLRERGHYLPGMSPSIQGMMAAPNSKLQAGLGSPTPSSFEGPPGLFLGHSGNSWRPWGALACAAWSARPCLGPRLRHT